MRRRCVRCPFPVRSFAFCCFTRSISWTHLAAAPRAMTQAPPARTGDRSQAAYSRARPRSGHITSEVRIKLQSLEASTRAASAASLRRGCRCTHQGPSRPVVRGIEQVAALPEARAAAAASSSVTSWRCSQRHACAGGAANAPSWPAPCCDREPATQCAVLRS